MYVNLSWRFINIIKDKFINKLTNVDCMSKEGLITIPSQSIDMVLVDLPYGVTKASHDKTIPLNDYVTIYLRGRDVPLYEDEYYLYAYKTLGFSYTEAKDYFNSNKKVGLMTELFRVVKDNGAVILFGQDKFTVDLINSARKYHRYNLIWDKVRSTGFLNAKKQPLRAHEDILVFYKKLPVYNPQKVKGKPNHSRGRSDKPLKNSNYGEFKFVDNREDLGDMKYPTSIVTFPKEHPPIFATQKSLNLCKWLIKTYSNEGDIILDCCAGSGSSLLAAKQTKRNYVGFELQEDNFLLGLKRLNEDREIQ